MDIAAAKQIAIQTMMDCLGYAAHAKTPMYSARLGVVGPQILFLGSVSGDTLDDYLDSAVAFLTAKELNPATLAECKERALTLVDILSAD